MGKGLDPVTFPGMGPLREKYVSETLKNSNFLLESNFKYFFSVSQPLIFFKCLCLSSRYVTRLQCQKGKVQSHSLVWGPLRGKYVSETTKKRFSYH